jgi:hypothetical protein
MMNECCGQGGLAIYGCMDDGNKGNDYLNNQGTYANPQYGSVNPGTPALTYYAGATQDDGSCIYVQQVSGCKDPNASNYDPNADTDCGNSHVSDFNINYTNFQGIQPAGTWTPYGDTSCCTYKPVVLDIDYDYRPGSVYKPGGIAMFNDNNYQWGIGYTYLQIQMHRLNAELQQLPVFPINSIINIETYNGFEQLIGSWDYKITAIMPCGANQACIHKYGLKLVQQVFSGFDMLGNSTAPVLVQTNVVPSNGYQSFYYKITSLSGVAPHIHANTSTLNNYAGLGINIRHTGDFGFIGSGVNPSNPLIGDYVWFWSGCTHCSGSTYFPTSPNPNLPSGYFA